MGRLEFVTKLAEALDTPAEAVTDDMPLSEEALDSLALLSVVAAADEEYGVTVSPGAVAQCRSVRDLVALVESAEPGEDWTATEHDDSGR